VKKDIPNMDEKLAYHDSSYPDTIIQ